MYLTWLDSNSWLIEMAGQRILLDPWLVGPLMFGNLPWLFKAERPKPRSIPAEIDLILLSQGLEDHAHPATLQQLDKTIPVVASPSAAKVVEQLGYTQVTRLAHGQTHTLQNKLAIRATVGSPIGPTVRENGYLLTELATNTNLYYEPHGYHSPELSDLAPVDVVITPLLDLYLLMAPFIKGGQTALEVVKLLQPQYVLPTAAGGEVKFEGLLMAVLRAKGGTEAFRQSVVEHNLSTQVIEPAPGDRLHIQPQSRVASRV
ncbi:MAG: MBL fold metallo-hydrolase [Aphanocapsa sp. GSE-SYN-MK-11-07L]|jgi:L-ascorbate metabolism protein UlaG (beta-lactamase superfamily)|nr:MBL fold metallo-hydrolase [Aphanocapsa sp. GSE-SYN-MK-11-07L]